MARVILLFVCVVALGAGVPGLGADEDTSYPRRLEAVRQIANRFPGHIRRTASEYRDLGLLAGIYMQTKWQMNSGRDALSIWSLVNQSLTLAPMAYMREYEADTEQPCELSDYVRANPTRDPDPAPIIQAATCRAWKAYFQASDSPQRTRVTHLLWHAHTTSIRHAVWQHAERFKEGLLPEEELAFWRGWIRLVFFGEKVAPSTTDLLLKPFLVATMPARSPLGIEGFRINDQPTLRRAFLVWLTRGHVDQEQLQQVFAEPGEAPPEGFEKLAEPDAGVDPVVERLLQDVIDHHRKARSTP